MQNDDQSTLVERIAHDYIGLIVAKPMIAEPSIDQVLGLAEKNVPLGKTLATPEFQMAARNFVAGPKEELHLAGVFAFKLCQQRSAYSAAKLTVIDVKKCHEGLLCNGPTDKLILDKEKIWKIFWEAYAKWLTRTYPLLAKGLLWPYEL